MTDLIPFKDGDFIQRMVVDISQMGKKEHLHTYLETEVKLHNLPEHALEDCYESLLKGKTYSIYQSDKEVTYEILK